VVNPTNKVETVTLTKEKNQVLMVANVVNTDHNQLYLQ
jgi:hypothetical protein